MTRSLPLSRKHPTVPPEYASAVGPAVNNFTEEGGGGGRGGGNTQNSVI